MFVGYSASVNQALQKFDEAACDAARPYLNLIRNKLAICDYELLLVPCNSSNPDHLIENSHIKKNIIDLHNAWAIIRGEGLTDMAAQEKAWAIIDEIGGVVTLLEKMVISPNLRRFQNDPTGRFFFVLLTGKEPEGLPIYELNMLCNLWQLEHGFIPIHAAGVIHRGRLFLFGGVSGAGKSTISSLSAEIGDKVLDEDQLSLYSLADERYSASAWGYSIETCNFPLSAIFKIVHSKSDLLIPLKSTQVAQFLMRQILQVTENNLLSDDMLTSCFKQVSGIARSIPGYELHFRKSPAFWKLIDERFP
jgi:hypothetical protein